jgi:hypothetical protein
MDGLWNKIAKAGPDECWVWTGAVSSGRDGKPGYGHLTVKRKNCRAHRLVWASTHGKIPEGLSVCHKCDNTLCCNPAHLFLGTHAENMKDKSLKLRVKAMPGSTNPIAKLSETDIPRIHKLRQQGYGYREIAEQYAVSTGLVSAILGSRAWKHVPR